MRTTKRLGVSLLSLTAAMAVSNAALAQDPQGGASEPARLDEIIVQATKRAESLFDVPVAVTAYSSEQLQAAQVRDVRDLQIVAPTLAVNSSTGSTQTVFTIRGIGTAGQNTGLEQSVGVFIDGVYRGRPGAALGDLADVSQIEVLRGPQGTLFGRNTSGGVIAVQTREPEFVPGGQITASAGDYAHRQFMATVTGPLLDDTLAGRLTVTSQERDGYVDDFRVGGTYNDRSRWSVKGQLLWDISPEATLRLIADRSETEEVCCAAVPVFYGPTSAAIAALGGTLRTGTAGSYGGVAGRFVDNTIYDVALNPTTQPLDDSSVDQGISAQLDWNLGATDLTVIASRRTFETMPTVDADFTNLNMLAQTTGQDITEGSLEVRLASADPDARLEWLIGGFLFNQDIFADQELRYGTQLRAYIEAITPRVPVAPGVTVPILTRLEQATGRPVGTFLAPGVAVNDDYDYESRSAALFGQATWNATAQLAITGGLRYSREEKSADYRIQSFDQLSQIQFVGPLAAFAALRSLQLYPAVNPFSAEIKDDDLSGTVSVAYELSDEVNLFARYARGYKSGGFNLNRTAAQTVPGNPVADPNKVIFDPEVVDAFELGTKVRFWDGRGQLNANLFFQALEDYQTNAFDGTSFRISNAGGMESKGLEWDYRIRLTDNIIIDGGGTLQDVQYTDFANAQSTAAQVLAGQNVQDLSGKTPNFVSDILISGGITYETPLTGSLGMRANLNYLYRSEYATAQDLDPLSFQDGYVMLNASVGIGSLDEAWGLEFWVRNLTDERVANIVFDTVFQAGSQSAFMEAPRTMGMTLRHNF
jgi:outer membrane receptor protein involved in Fe transport